MLVGLQAGWGDDARDPLDAPLNPHFSQEALSQYSSSTQRNIARLDEDRIDFDLLEELVTYIDQEYGDGAILVFLPGIPPPPLYHQLAYQGAAVIVANGLKRPEALSVIPHTHTSAKSNAARITGLHCCAVLARPDWVSYLEVQCPLMTRRHGQRLNIQLQSPNTNWMPDWCHSGTSNPACSAVSHVYDRYWRNLITAGAAVKHGKVQAGPTLGHPSSFLCVPW